jgi:hypothetical protein
MRHHRPAAAVSALALAILAAILEGALAAGCAQGSAAAVYPEADLRPPGLLEAGPTDPRSVRLRFDEAVTPVPGSFSSEPPASLEPRADGGELTLSFSSAQAPGLDYALSGEVEDGRGNRTRFLLRFTGWNDRVPSLRLSEAQTGKNSSKSNPHRDYLELEALGPGNIGGVELSWSSSAKSASYRFPGIEVGEGDFIVLHLAPEGLDAERDELGGELAASGGADACPTARDLWYGAMALPDESGVVALSPRPGAPPVDGLFYAAEAKSGALPDDGLGQLVARLGGSGAWPLGGEKPAWEDAYRWKSSPARSLCRARGGVASAAVKETWYVSATGGQSPGYANAAPDAKAVAKGEARKLQGKVSKKVVKKASTKKAAAKKP